MDYIVMAHLVMAYIVMAHIVMAYIVMVAGVKMREGAFNNGAEGPNSVNMTYCCSNVSVDTTF